MNKTGNSKASIAGGFFIALGLLIGVGIGLYTNEISLGMIAGFSFGIAAAIMVWLFDRTRKQ